MMHSQRRGSAARKGPARKNCASNADDQKMRKRAGIAARLHCRQAGRPKIPQERTAAIRSSKRSPCTTRVATEIERLSSSRSERQCGSRAGPERRRARPEAAAWRNPLGGALDIKYPEITKNRSTPTPSAGNRSTCASGKIFREHEARRRCQHGADREPPQLVERRVSAFLQRARHWRNGVQNFIYYAIAYRL